MLVFLSWSKTRSKKMAEALDNGLRFVLQNVEPWFSAVDIESGDRWNSTLTDKLAEAKCGVLCVTQENVAEPWLLFEAGAIAKTVHDKARVCPVLLDLTPGQMTGPLTQFQALRTESQDEMLKLFVDINSWVEHAGESACDQETLRQRFEAHWPTLHPMLDAIREEPVVGPVPEARPTDDKVEEILRIVRQLPRDQVVRPPPAEISGALGGLAALGRVALADNEFVKSDFNSLLESLGGLLAKLEHLETIADELHGEEDIAERPDVIFVDQGLDQLRREMPRFVGRVNVTQLETLVKSLDAAQIRLLRIKLRNLPAAPETQDE